MNIGSWCDRVIKIGFYLLFILVPIILTPVNYELFEYNKMMVTYGLTVIIVGSWLCKMVSNKEIRIAKTPFDIPVLLFVASQFVSALFSMDPHVSWFGYYSRFNGGMWSIVSYVLLYYAFVSNFQLSVFGSRFSDRGQPVNRSTGQPMSDNRKLKTENVFSLLKVILSTATIVALYGVLEHFGIDKHLWVQDVQNRVFSTLGQPNWLAAYLTALVPLTWYFALKPQIPSTKSETSLAGRQANPKFQAPNPKQSVWNIGILNLDIVSNLGFWIWTLIAALFFLVLLYTRSRSGLVGFAIADIVFWGLFFFGKRFTFTKNKYSSSESGSAGRVEKSISMFSTSSNDKRILFPFIICHVSFIILVFLNGTNIESIDRYLTLKSWKERFHSSTIQQFNNVAISPSIATPSGTLLETGGTESGTIRKYVWQGAINAWNSSWKTRLIGTGTETFAFAFYQYKPKEHNLTSEWDFLYNKAHNEYLNYLATTGALGLGSYLFLLVTFIVWFVKQFLISNSLISKQISNSKSQLDQLEIRSMRNYVAPALFSGWLSILITNFFGFSVVVVQLLLFLFPAIMVAGTMGNDRTNELSSYKLSLPSNRLVNKVISFAILFVLLVLLIFLSKFWYADKLFASGYRASRAGLLDKAAPFLSHAIALNTDEPLYHDETATVYAGLAVAAVDSRDATKAAELAKRSLKESDEAISISPNNVNFWKTRTKVYYSFSSFDPVFNKAAIESLGHALSLSPNDPKIAYNLAILYGRESNNTKAIDLLKTAIVLKPNYKDAYWALAIFYDEVKQPELAKTILTQYLNRVDPTDKEFIDKLNEAN